MLISMRLNKHLKLIGPQIWNERYTYYGIHNITWGN